MTGKNYDVIIIGAGPGGVTCGALLAKWGMKTLVVDKNSRPGGKMITLSKNGFRYELFPVYGVPAYNSLFEMMAKELGIEDKVDIILPDPVGALYYKTSSGEINEIVLPGDGTFVAPEKLFAFMGVKDDEMEESIRFFAEMVEMKSFEIDRLDNVSVEEFLSQYNLPQGLVSFMICMQGEGVLEVPVDVACASEFIRNFQGVQQGGGGRYFGRGFGTVFEAFADAMKSFGGELVVSSRVEKIGIKDGRVREVVTQKETFKAPIVISSAGIQPTVLKLVGEEHFDKSYVNYVKDLVPSLAVCGARYILNKPVLKYPMLIFYSDKSVSDSEHFQRAIDGELPEEPYVYVGTTSLYPGMAPEGKQLVHSGISCPPDPKMDIQPWLDKCEEMVGTLWPEILEHVESKEYYGPKDASAISRDQVLLGKGGECFGVGQIVGQAGRNAPSINAPIRGLYYVGGDAGGQGLGTHNAVESGIAVAKAVRRYFNTHRNSF